MTCINTGRRIRALGAHRCCICGIIELAKGGSHHFRCSACKESGKYFGKYFAFDHGGGHAMGLVSAAIRNGDLKLPAQFECSDCGVQAAEYDHRDYNKPLDVEPVCRSCNLKRGPAIPKRGYFDFAFQNNHPPYRNKMAALKLFSLLGIAVDHKTIPGSLRIEHWLPYKEALLATELTEQPSPTTEPA